MAYRIEYGTGNKKLVRKATVHFLIVSVICLFLLYAANNFLGNGQALIWSFLFPGGDAVTQTAIQCMITDLREGESFVTAVTAFCETIVNHAMEQS